MSSSLFACNAIGLALLTATTVGASPPQNSFASFHASFRTAMTAGDADGLVSLTRLPFLFQGRAQDAAGLRREVWPALFTPALRRCWARAQALSEPGQPTERSLHCAPYTLHFGTDAAGWYLREFSADGEP